MIDIPDFDALYRDDPDPWQVASSFYEQRKLSVLLACLTQPSYTAAWDPASGTGALAGRLADRAAAVLATDSSAEAVRLTASSCAGRPNVTVRQLRQPEPPGQSEEGFDLLVIAEFAYYLPRQDRAGLWQVVSDAAAPSAEIVLVHWRHRPHDGFLSGVDVQSEAVQQLTTQYGWWTAVQHDDRDFVLDVLRRGLV